MWKSIETAVSRISQENIFAEQAMDALKISESDRKQYADKFGK